MKIPLLNEIHPFDNTEKVYQSISGDTFENWSSEKPAQDDFDHDSRQLCCSIECPKVFRFPK